MKEAPVYFSGPNDEVAEVDPYEEFEIPEDELETEAEENRVDDEEIVLDEEDKPLDIDDIVERTSESLDRAADTIKEVSEEIVDDIVEGVNEAISNPKDYFFDKNGTKHLKDQFLDFDKLVKIIASIDSIFGVLCVDGISDDDFKYSYTGNTLLDLLRWGLFTYARCFIAKATTEGYFDSMQDKILSSAISSLSSNTMSNVLFMDEIFDDGSLSILDNSFTSSVMDSYFKPPSVTSLTDELNRVEDSLDKVTPDWLTDGSPFSKDDYKVERRKLEFIKEASDDLIEIFDHDLYYLDSLAVAQEYDKETEFHNYPFST